jgi:hypothetical protein
VNALTAAKRAGASIHRFGVPKTPHGYQAAVPRERGAYSKCQKFFPNYREDPLFEKRRFSGPFRQKLSSYSEITLMLFRTLPVAPGCNNVSENEKPSGNRYRKCLTALWHDRKSRALVTAGRKSIVSRAYCLVADAEQYFK